MSAQLREDKLPTRLLGEEEKVQVENGSLPSRLFNGIHLNLSNDAKSVESKKENVTSWNLAEAREKRKAEMLKSPSFKRVVARRRLNLLGREQVSSDGGKVPKVGVRTFNPPVPTPEKVRVDQLECQLTAMLQHMKLLEVKL